MVVPLLFLVQFVLFLVDRRPEAVAHTHRGRSPRPAAGPRLDGSGHAGVVDGVLGIARECGLVHRDAADHLPSVRRAPDSGIAGRTNASSTWRASMAASISAPS